jgi:PBP1b-binding outer membrane lipoprotein LpoB
VESLLKTIKFGELIMKKTMMFLSLLGLVFLLAACSSDSGNEASETETTEDTAVQTTTSDVNLTENFDDALTIQAQLALGTVQLDDTNLAVDESQAATLLPLWQALQTLSQSDTTAEVELQAVVNQIEGSMKAEQINAIAAMQLTEASMTELAESGDLALGRGFGGGNGEQRGAGQGQGGPGGFAGGSLPGAGPGGGGFLGGGPGTGGPGGGNLSEDDIAARQAQFE